MVQKAVASFGLVLLVAGLALGIVIAVLEDWVRAALVGADSCAADSATPLGSLGLFAASFRPTCAEGSPFEASYSTFKEIESGPTLEFWPLFPAQNSFGGNLGELGEFSSCEETFKEGSAERTAARAAVVTNVDSRVFSAADGGLQTLGELVREEIFGLTMTVDQVFGGLWEDSIEEAVTGSVAPAIVNLTVATGLPDGILNGLAAQGIVSYADNETQIKPFGQFYSVVTKDEVSTGLFGEPEAGNAYTGAAAINFFFSAAAGQIAGFDASDASASPQLLAVDAAIATASEWPPILELDPDGVDLRLGQLGTTISGVLLSNLITLSSAGGGCSVPNPEGVYPAAFPFAALNATAAFESVEFDLCAIKSAIATASQAGNIDAVEALGALAGFMGLCDGQTGAECAKDTTKAFIPSDMSGPHLLSIAFFSKYDSIPASLRPANPAAASAVDLVKVIGAIASGIVEVDGFDLSGAVPLEIRPQIPTLVGAAVLCGAGGLAWDNENITRADSCQAFIVNPVVGVDNRTSPELVAESYEQQFSLPEAWDSTVAFTPCRAPLKLLPALNITVDVTSGSCDYADFAYIMLLLSDIDVPADNEDAAALIAAAKQLLPVHAIVKFCLDAGLSDRSSCAAGLGREGPLLLPFLSSEAMQPVLQGIEVQVFEQFYSDITSVEMALEACKDDDLDGEAIERAQVLVPAALASMGVALLLAIALIATEKKALAFASGLLSATGGVLILVGFLGVQAAPVYESVGVEKKEGEAEYSPGLAQILGLVSIAASVIGGCLLAGSACCGNEESDDDRLVAKMDNV